MAIAAAEYDGDHDAIEGTDYSVMLHHFCIGS